MSTRNLTLNSAVQGFFILFAVAADVWGAEIINAGN
jgi:hypothetical protein